MYQNIKAVRFAPYAEGYPPNNYIGDGRFAYKSSDKSPWRTQQDTFDLFLNNPYDRSMVFEGR